MARHQSSSSSQVHGRPSAWFTTIISTTVTAHMLTKFTGGVTITRGRISIHLRLPFFTKTSSNLPEKRKKSDVALVVLCREEKSFRSPAASTIIHRTPKRFKRFSRRRKNERKILRCELKSQWKSLKIKRLKIANKIRKLNAKLRSFLTVDD